MTHIVISRTRALKRFREKLGSPIRNLNSVVVGLCAVGNGIATKPADLAVSWEPKDLKRAEVEARGFAIRSLMVAACDALDHYLEDIGIHPTPINDTNLTSILRKEVMYESVNEKLSNGNIQSLSNELVAINSDVAEIRKTLKKFSDRYCGKPKRPSIRFRLSALNTHCKKIPHNANRPPLPHESYFSAIEILIAWRNHLVHETEAEQLGSNALEVISQHGAYLAQSHSNIDVEVMIANFKAQNEPSLKEISTLVSILVRFISAIDAVLLAESNLEDFFEQAVTFELSNSDKAEQLVKHWATKTYEERLRKALNFASPHGFVPSSSQFKKGAYKSKILDDGKLKLIRGWCAKDILGTPN